MKALRVYIGWDRREPDAYEVARHSVVRRASIPVEVHALKLDELRERGLYWREIDPLAATDFTYSRFLTPHLAGTARGTPEAIHFTRGGPWFEQWGGVDYADLWCRELEILRGMT